MPLGSPIGSNRGVRTRDMIEIIVEQSHVPVVVDAGIGLPSHAAEAIELGADAVLVNTAIAAADDPVKMAEAFRLAVAAAELGVAAGPRSASSTANATSPSDIFVSR
jgi:thiazole synthase